MSGHRLVEVLPGAEGGLARTRQDERAHLLLGLQLPQGGHQLVPHRTVPGVEDIGRLSVMTPTA